jgi:hypothetical protein
MRSPVCSANAPSGSRPGASNGGGLRQPTAVRGVACASAGRWAAAQIDAAMRASSGSAPAGAGGSGGVAALGAGEGALGGDEATGGDEAAGGDGTGAGASREDAGVGPGAAAHAATITSAAVRTHTPSRIREDGREHSTEHVRPSLG